MPSKIMQRALDFIQVWERSNSIDDVVSQVNKSRATIYAYAKSLRGKGVQLKKFRGNRGLSSLEIAQLNSTIKKTHQTK